MRRESNKEISFTNNSSQNQRFQSRFGHQTCKKGWLDRIEDACELRGLVGFPGDKLREVQKENKAKFGEEFIEIMLARFKMSFTVKV